MTDFHIVIPARYGSSRLPAKPLALIGGTPMVVRTARSVSQANPRSLTVATDDERIASVVRDAGFRVCMTRTDHPSGSDRVLEVADQSRWGDDEIVINVQGDEPMMPASVLRQLADRLAVSTVGVATLCEPILERADVFNPNVVKVVRDADGRALYFSRAPIPWDRAQFGGASGSPLASAPGYFRHIGVYAYRLRALRDFVCLPPSGLETVEALEQLRLLEAGRPILVLDSCAPVPGGVDTSEDLERVNRSLGAT